MLASSGASWAIGLGTLTVQSSLGEVLKAEIDVTSLSSEEAANLRVRIASPEAYRTAGIEYNLVLSTTKSALERRPDGTQYLSISTERSVQEPFLDVILEISWLTGKLVREYTVLLDPPGAAAKAVAPGVAASGASTADPPKTAPVIGSASTTSTVPVAPESQTSTVTETPKSVPVPTRAVKAEQYVVQPGDTLARIAGRAQSPGISLDQMLVALYRSNPQAFVGNNMNRLRSGAVLSIPSAEAANLIPNPQARETIQAQSADFGAYRERLADAAPAAPAEQSSRKAVGKVQASVKDQQSTTSAPPDVLTLSKRPGDKSARADDVTASLSKQSEARANAARQQELSRNLEELKQVANSAKMPTAPVAPATVTVGKPAAISAPPIPALPTLASAPQPSLPNLQPSAPVAASASMVASQVAQAASAAASTTPSAASAAPPLAASAPKVGASAKPPVKPSAAPPAVAETGFFAALLEDNLLAIGGGILVLLALGGYAWFKFSRRGKSDGGETSFLESRLQPDSFFGASGGQRIDTRDAATSQSSASYSLSQLDAIGDVDPVAEADVYLAYGRDLQAEEILKEALRSTPDRLAIRTKLLEVYVKRRDVKGFELLATQLFTLTRGMGEDWAKAQELGRQLDPENPQYRPGGAPVLAQSPAGQAVEPLGASTMPQSVIPAASAFGDSAMSAIQGDRNLLDLDLDLGSAVSAPLNSPPQASPPAPAKTSARARGESTQPIARNSFIENTIRVAPPAGSSTFGAAVAPSAFNLSNISLELGATTQALSGKTAAKSSDFGDLNIDDLDAAASGDPFSRKLELAEEFRQIGDFEGARDLLKEVAAKATGAAQTKARSMLASLG
jgi:pilus assembly protein FimV